MGDIDTLLSDLERGRHDPVYVVWGEEPFLVSQALDALKSYAFERTPRDFNYDRYELRETKLEQILATAETLPMMGPFRLVVIRGADALLAPAGGQGGSQRKAAQQKEDLVLLERYLSDPPAQTILVLVAERIDRRRRAVRLAGDAGRIVHAKPPYENEIPRWIARRAPAHGLRVGPAEASLLADILGTELGSIERSLEKLALYLGERDDVRTEDIEACVAETRVHAVYALPNAVAEKDHARALRLLHGMLARTARGRRDLPIRVVAMLVRQFRQIWMTRSLMDAGTPRRELADRVGFPAFRTDAYCREARSFSEIDLQQAMERLFRVDRALKTSRGDPERVLELLVLDLCR